MFFPLKVDQPTRSNPTITVAIIAACSLVWMWEVLTDVGLAVFKFGLIPDALVHGTPVDPRAAAADPILTLFTSMFVHGGWMHLIGNMLFLWVFGNSMEDAVGKFRFILLYLLSGLGAAGLQILTDPGSQLPMVGASGAISGVLGAYLILYPNSRVVTLVFFGIVTIMQIRAKWMLGIWIAYQVFFALVNAGSPGGGTAWFAHIGGFVFGAGLIFLLKPGRRPDFEWSWARKKRLKEWQEPRQQQPPEPQKRQDDNVTRGPWG